MLNDTHTSQNVCLLSSDQDCIRTIHVLSHVLQEPILTRTIFVYVKAEQSLVLVMIVY